jgi:hypothetical protein
MVVTTSLYQEHRRIARAVNTERGMFGIIQESMPKMIRFSGRPQQPE